MSDETKRTTQPCCPKGREWLELNFEWDKSEREYIDRENGRLYTIDQVLDLFSDQFFPASEPPK